jgi:hypothetical protein
MTQYKYPMEVQIADRQAAAARRRKALVAAGCSTYELGHRGTSKAIQCLCCGLGSTHPTDIAQRFCGFCKELHSEWVPEVQT